MPNSSFCVSRTAFKDSTSHYEINGKRAPFKEVASLLRAKGVDLDHNRFLILQGEVEQIALMKPKALNPHDAGMLEFLEDIIGSNRFQEPIELLKRTVSELEDRRSEKLNRVKLVEKEKDELEGPMKKAMEFIKSENEVVEKKNVGYQRYVYECNKKIEVIEDKRKKYEESAQETIEKVEAVSKQKEEKEKEYSQCKKDWSKVQVELEKAQEDFNSHDKLDNQLREEMKATNIKRKKLATLVKEQEAKLEHLSSVPEANKKKIEECEELKQKKEAELKDEEEKYDKAAENLRSETQEYQDEKEKLEAKLVGLRKEVDEKDSVLKLAQDELNLAKSKEEREKCRLEQMEGNLNTFKVTLTNSSERKEVLAKKIPATEKSLKEYEAKLDKATQDDDKLRRDVVSKRGALNEQQQEKQAHKSHGRVIDALMEEKRLGRIPGIFGRLGDLGNIDRKYDVAVSTAGGGGLDQILVDSPETGKACINFLKKNNVGRGNFLALNKTERWVDRANNKLKTPQNADRLFDLIQPVEPRFATAFYHVLKDTLVARDIKQAQEVAFGEDGRRPERFRTVTFRGEIINVDGAMIGGGNPIKGKMGTDIKDRRSIGEAVNFEQLQAQLDEALEVYEANNKIKTEAEIAVAKFKKELNEYRREENKINIELNGLEARIANLEKDIAKQKKILAQSRPDPKHVEELKSKIEACEAEYEKAKEKSGSIEFEVKKLNAKIKDIMGSKLKAIQKKVDDTKAQLDKVKKELTRLDLEIKKSERDMEKCKDKKEGYETEKSEAENKMRDMNTKRQELEKIGKEALEEVAKKKKDEEEMKEKVHVLSKDIEKLKEAEDKVKSKQIEINQQREKFDAEVKEQKKARKHWKRELEKLKFRDVPGQETPELKEYPEDALEELDVEKWQYELTAMEEKITSQKVNLAAIDEYRQKESVYLERVNELEAITGKKDKQKKNHDELRKMRLNEFMEGFSIITAKLKEMYQMITLGGDAELELVDSLDPFTEGIVFSVRPPSKSWKNISNLSGGEKTLSSLALVFALHYYKPTPLYVMDEIDAALDFKNVSIVANYIKERTKNAQFIIISLRSNMFELADRLVGIYKTHNCTKSATINPGKIANEEEPMPSASGTQKITA